MKIDVENLFEIHIICRLTLTTLWYTNMSHITASMYALLRTVIDDVTYMNYVAHRIFNTNLITLYSSTSRIIKVTQITHMMKKIVAS